MKCRKHFNPDALAVSLPAWECGLKSLMALAVSVEVLVTPCVGVWIEINQSIERRFFVCVTPCVGVWIEINLHESNAKTREWSLPAWECGLKFIIFAIAIACKNGHSLRGSVD